MRGLAVFFLLFTGADLLLPQYFCGEGEIGGVTIMTASASAASEPDGGARFTIPSTPADHQPTETPDKAPHDEDCFCCCAHVLPTFAFATVGTFELNLPSAPPAEDHLQSPPLRGTYHPPRIA